MQTRICFIQLFSMKGPIYMSSLKLKIDKTKCIHCGLCIKDCSCSVLEFDENKFPKVAENGDSRCMECQHCLAVCPVAALSILGKNPENSVEIFANHNPENILNLIQTRRSVRQFKKENIDKKLLKKLQDMLKWTPTGCNDHRLMFTFIDDCGALEKFKYKTYSCLKELFAQRPFPKEASKLLRFKEPINKGLDPVFRNAPHMVIVSSPVDAPCASVDPIIALSYFELYAQSMGIGTLWCGLAYYCLDLLPNLVKELNIPDGYKPQYCMLFGNPAVTYKRGIQPKEFKIITYRKFMARFEAFVKNLKIKFLNFVK